MPTVALCMIVKDEGAVIRRCLTSALPFITHWAIVDTGSTDNTRAVVEETMAGAGLPGVLLSHPFEDFATNRNQALEAARSMGAEYALVLDADEVLESEERTFGRLGAPRYAMRLRMREEVWHRLTLVRLDIPWRYVGDIHETLVCDGVDDPVPVLSGFGIVNHADGGSSADDVAKCERYAAMLRDLTERQPDTPRHWYYLGQALAGAQRIDDAITVYEHRARMPGGHPEEAYNSLFQIARLKEFRGDDVAEILAAYEQAYEARPTRSEPLWAISVLLQNGGKYALAEIYARAACRIPQPLDSLNVVTSVYQWRAVAELANCLAALNRPDEAVELWRKMLHLECLPDQERRTIERNIEHLTVELDHAA